MILVLPDGIVLALLVTAALLVAGAAYIARVWVVRVGRYLLVFIESLKPKNASALAILSRRRVAAMNANLKFAVVATVWLFIIYYVEAYLEQQYGILSTSNVLGFILIALLTAFSLFWVVKKAKASPNI
jgi:hypothetical protein